MMEPLNNRTVLLVDDDAAVAAALENALKANGYRVLVARDGLEALDFHESHADAIHLLITDLEMPNMNGQDLARRLVQDRPDLPIIFMSGSPNPDPPFSPAAFPNHLFLQKPFLPSALLAKLSSVLSS